MSSGIKYSCAYLMHSYLTTTAIWKMRWKADSNKGVTQTATHTACVHFGIE